tara:strand:- start:286 stop:465 length:180 start_codon:yes stop_codon:yes gene_type:complete
MTKKVLKFEFTEQEASYLYEEIHRIEGYVGILGTNPEPWEVCSKFCTQYQDQITTKENN